MSETHVSHTATKAESFSTTNMPLNTPDTGEQTIERVLATCDLEPKFQQLARRTRHAKLPTSTQNAGERNAMRKAGSGAQRFPLPRHIRCVGLPTERLLPDVFRTVPQKHKHN